MSAKGREALGKIFGSADYLSWSVKLANTIDARKLAFEYTGTQKRTCGSKYAQGLQTLCRENPPTIPPPNPTAIPEPFSGRGMVLLEPTGGVESIKDLKDAGFTYALLNLAYVAGGSWDTVRSRCGQLGIEVVPWRRVQGPQDSAQIENAATAWQCRATAHNLETEAGTTYPPFNLANYVGANYPARTRAVITEPWAQNGAGWEHLAGWVGMPEAFLNASDRYLPLDLVTHLQDEGIPRCAPLHGWGIWSDAPKYVPPSQYLSVWPSPRPYAVYFGDSREPQYSEWKPS